MTKKRAILPMMIMKIGLLPFFFFEMAGKSFSFLFLDMGSEII
jgi:hypothetical protein